MEKANIGGDLRRTTDQKPASPALAPVPAEGAVSEEKSASGKPVDATKASSPTPFRPESGARWLSEYLVRTRRIREADGLGQLRTIAGRPLLPQPPRRRYCPGTLRLRHICPSSWSRFQ